MPLPFAFCRDHRVLLVEQDGSAVLHHVAPLAPDIIAEVRRVLGRPLQLLAVEPAQFQQRLTAAFRGDADQAHVVAEGLGAGLDLARLAEDVPEASELMDGEDDAPVIRLINALLSQAVRERASDIHVETFEDQLVVRLRVDGMLREILRPRRMFAPLLISRLKVMAQLDIAERRVPQDGRITVKVAGHPLDIRVSTLPSMHGERVVLRLLDEQQGLIGLDRLGMSTATRDSLERVLGSPHGIILVTGPTGSGKTTTLYAGLSHINERSRNILTIEDPIEYQLRGIGQTQVNPRVDMGFARGLRAILRQDPDVIMVGEIRDAETARIAVQASLTGHLVLSTLHTNTGIGAVTRLRDMGIEPFLLSSSLLAVLAQRLVRLLCPDCRRTREAGPRERELLGVSGRDVLVLSEPGGCGLCMGTGFRGRTGIYELVVVDEAMRTLIHEGAPEQRLVDEARRHAPGIAEDGRRRVLDGDTSLGEVLRVTTLE